MDLLIVIIREIGHLLGHDYVAVGLIAETLTAGKEMHEIATVVVGE